MSEQHSTPDILARRLDQALPPGKSFTPPVTPDPLVNTATEIAKLSMPTLSSKASSRIEAQMLAAFDQQHQPRVIPRTRRPSRTTGLVARWALAACAAIVLIFAGLTPSVSAAVPGEPLYGVKQLYERVELATAFSPSAQAGVYLEHANRRVQESLTLLERNQFDPALADAVLSNIAEASKSSAEIRKSASLRAQLYQTDLMLGFVLQDAHQNGLVAQEQYHALAQQIEQVRTSDLLIPSDDELTPEPSGEGGSAATPEATLEATAESTSDPNGDPNSDSPGNSDQPCEHGQSCLSQGVPGGQIIKPTPRPTNVHRDIQPTPRSNSSNNSGGNSSNNGNSNGGGNSSGGNSSGNSNAGGNGNGNGGGNGNGNGNGNGKGG